MPLRSETAAGFVSGLVYGFGKTPAPLLRVLISIARYVCSRKSYNGSHTKIVKIASLCTKTHPPLPTPKWVGQVVEKLLCESEQPHRSPGVHEQLLFPS